MNKIATTDRNNAVYESRILPQRNPQYERMHMMPARQTVTENPVKPMYKKASGIKRI